MSLLAALLPGVRELRTPMAVGALWLSTIALLSYPHREYLAGLQGVATARSLLGAFPGFDIAAALFAAYIVGIVLQGAVRSVGRGRLIAFAQQRLDLRVRVPSTIVERFLLQLHRPNERVTVLVRNTIAERLQPLLPAVARAVPVELVQDEFHLAALRLSKDAPDQYQQYDRLRAEAEFRRSVALPFFTVGLSFASLVPALPAVVCSVVALAICCVLAWQGLQQHHTADEQLASAIYFAFSSTPLLDVLVKAAETTWPGDEDSQERQMAWFLEFLLVRHMDGLARRTISAMKHPSRGQEDLVETVLELVRPELRDRLEVARPWTVISHAHLEAPGADDSP